MLQYSLTPKPWGYIGKFSAMASPCELLIESRDEAVANAMMHLSCKEAARIEQKYSRFIEGNLLWLINHSQGKAIDIDIDIETANLLQFAQHCYQMSEGRFDITAGPLISQWRFDDKSQPPTETALEQARQFVGFSRVEFNQTQLTMPKGMTLDFGGIGKEYAADRVAQQLASMWQEIAVLVNFGGDIACPIAKADDNSPWQVGIENPQALNHAAAMISIRQGGLATSGDTRRFIEHRGRRFGHIINPKDGYPVEGAPRSVTVLANNCTTAGMLATMAMLEGVDAEHFLNQQQVEFKVFR